MKPEERVKHYRGLKDKLIRIQWSKIKVIVTSQIHVFVRLVALVLGTYFKLLQNPHIHSISKSKFASTDCVTS